MTFTGTLRPYQVEPVQRMKERGNMLLAAEQGTGKTTMTINVIEDLFDDETITEPGLVVCLSTLKEQWAEKIEEFTSGTSKSIIIPGGEMSVASRKFQYASAINWDADYILLHYEQVVNDWDTVSRLPMGFVIVDEASFIRGANSNRAKAVKNLARRTKYRFALTGTPIENGRPEEMFSIMEFVDPKVFGRWDIFDRTFIKRDSFGKVTRYRNLPTFHKTLAPAMIRLRSKDPEVAPYMPETDDNKPMLVPLDKAARGLYEYIARALIVDLEQAAKWGAQINVAAGYGQGQATGNSAQDALRGRIGSKMLALQMLCDHPDLLRHSAQRYIDTQGQHGSAYIADLVANSMLTDVHKAPKMTAARKWISDMLAMDDRNKIVVFTRYVRMAEILAEEIGLTARLYTGANVKERGANLRSFQHDAETRVLVATDAGGFGLDIPQANLLLNYDLPDGAGLADQRDTRIVRTSSEFATVSRNWIFVRNSIEEYKAQRLDQKRAVRDAFVDAQGLTAKGGVLLTAQGLLGFLRTNSV